MTDSIFDVVISFEKDYGAPDADAMKEVITGLEPLVKQCANVDVNISRYTNCVDYTYNMFADIK